MAALAVAACGGEDDESTRDRLVEVLQDADTAGLSAEDAECVADEMIAAGLTDDDLNRLEDFDGEGDPPAALDLYTQARVECDDL